MEIIKRFFTDYTDKKVEGILQSSLSDIEETNQRIESLNEIMESQSVTRNIARATGNL